MDDKIKVLTRWLQHAGNQLLRAATLAEAIRTGFEDDHLSLQLLMKDEENSDKGLHNKQLDDFDNFYQGVIQFISLLEAPCRVSKSMSSAVSKLVSQTKFSQPRATHPQTITHLLFVGISTDQIVNVNCVVVNINSISIHSFLAVSHQAIQSQSKVSCSSCQARYHTLLHFSVTTIPGNLAHGGPSKDNTVTSGPVNHSPSVTLVASQTCAGHDPQSVLLSTAMVDVQDSVGAYHTVQALLDSASHLSFISEYCVQCLGLARRKTHLPIHGLSQTSLYTAKGSLTTTIIRNVSREVLGDHILEKNFLSPEDKMCKLVFEATHRRQRSGAWNGACASNHKYMQCMYVAFMEDYLQCGHIELVDNPQKNLKFAYYLPYHGVIQEATQPQGFMSSLMHLLRRNMIMLHEAAGVTEATAIQKELIALLQADGFQLRKFPSSQREISRTFDPLGWLTPVLLFTKTLMQQLWLTGADEDDELPLDVLYKWENFKQDPPVMTAVAS
ncbi:hypothetical protein PR048_008595 [Dryococelus australis]|uniref:Uncharacterized protein n=1 Tax=Dryococelus australis TaxID=614101 RepID=A0ABQ9HYC7_9NEOP|nr:hypothetical protein PR048_008595 [Dryococelus australis]